MPPDDSPPPEVLLSLGFGDSPLEGEVLIVPAAVPSSQAWQYSVDIDNDGGVDASGLASTQVAVPYRLVEPGIHTISVTLERDSQRITHEKAVVVNDETLIATGPSRVLPFITAGGVVLDAGDENLYIGVGAIVRLDPVTLDQRERIAFEDATGIVEGLSLSPDQSRLYAVTRHFHLVALEAPELTSQFAIDLPFPKPIFFVHAVSRGRLYLGGRVLALMEVDTNTILQRLDLSEAWHFALSPDEDRIALVTRFTPALGELLMLDAQTFSILWRIPLEEDLSTLAVATAFSRDGDRVYVMQGPILGGTGGGSEWRFVVVEAESGEILRDMVVGRGCASVFCEGVANPVAITADERYAVFATGIGAFVVDRELDLPLARTSSFGCCNVATANTSNHFYTVHNTNPQVHVFEITR